MTVLLTNYSQNTKQATNCTNWQPEPTSNCLMSIAHYSKWTLLETNHDSNELIQYLYDRHGIWFYDYYEFSKYTVPDNALVCK